MDKIKIRKIVYKILLEILEDMNFDPYEDTANDLYIGLKDTIRNKLDIYE